MKNLRSMADLLLLTQIVMVIVLLIAEISPFIVLTFLITSTASITASISHLLVSLERSKP